MLASFRYRVSFSHCPPSPFTEPQYPTFPHSSRLREHSTVPKISHDRYPRKPSKVGPVEKADLGLSNLARKVAWSHRFPCSWLAFFVGMAEPGYSVVGPKKPVGRSAHTPVGPN